MPTQFIHLSDLHLRDGWHEEQGYVLRQFFDDLKRNIKITKDTYVLFSGDIVQSGSERSSYSLFSETFQQHFEEVGIDKNKIIFIPGNHDVDREYVRQNLSNFVGLRKTIPNETEFNNIAYGELKGQLSTKFKPFIDWQSQFNQNSFNSDNYCGFGFSVSTEIGIYCLNTSLYSFGGLKDKSGNTIEDKGFLPVETRRLNKWLNESKHQIKVLAMHHPTAWLNDWSCDELNRLCKNHFQLVICGHVHENDFHSVDISSNRHIRCIAPPLFTSKSETLGYSCITVDPDGHHIEINYRQWVKSKFVLGTALSETENGKIKFSLIENTDGNIENRVTSDFHQIILKRLESNFEKSLQCYSYLPPVWICPNISDTPETIKDADGEVVFSAEKLSADFVDTIICAPPQFGLSSLSHFIALECWRKTPGRFVVCLNSSDFQNHEKAVVEHINSLLHDYSLEQSDVAAIILDEENGLSERKIKNIKKVYKDIPLYVCLKISEQKILNDEQSSDSLEGFRHLYLWSLDRTQIRCLVELLVENNFRLDVDIAVNRLVDDLEVLNIHRTPVNCLTLLAVYEKEIDFSPANRAEMFERFLFLIFLSYKKNPDYSTFPDMKDSLHILGAFSELLIERQELFFTKRDYIDCSNNFCSSHSIEVDFIKIFDLLVNEQIIVELGSNFYFRYTHWVYFFAAHRMEHNAAFKEWILTDARYMNYPEIIEFYSGIDRQKNDLLQILVNDLKTVNSSFEEITKIDVRFEPYDRARWAPDTKQLNELKNKLKQEVSNTSLPDSVKDSIADKSYDRGRPYRQEISKFVRDSSLIECMQILSAAARALRNSDYADKEIKTDLINEILRAWKKHTQALFLLSPVLAEQGQANFHNIRFFLEDRFFELEGEYRWMAVVSAIPGFVIGIHEKDIASARMTPLFKEVLDLEKGGISELIVNSLLIRTRPQSWRKLLERSIKNADKDSYYLLKIFNELRHEYKYGFITSETKEDILHLLAITIAKHEKGIKAPNKKAIEATKEQIKSKLK